MKKITITQSKTSALCALAIVVAIVFHIATVVTVGVIS